MEKKKVIILGVALVAVILIVAGAAAALLSGTDSYTAKLELASKYLDEGDYTNAVLAYQEAIGLEPDREEAYYGLYQVYFATGNLDYAKTVLQNGLTRINSDLLRTASEELEASLAISQQPEPEPVTAEPEPEPEPAPEEDKTLNYTLNQELLTFFSSANFNDYTAKYGETAGTLSGDSYTMHVDSLAATLVFRNSSSVVVIDQTRGKPFGNFLPTEIRLDNVTVLFGGAPVSYTTMKNLSGVSNPSKSGNTITFHYANCEITVICDDNELITADSDNTIAPNSTAAEAEKHILAAKVVDAATGSYVSGAKIKAYAGYGTYGTPVEGTTDSTGRVSLELEEGGTYTLEISKEGYITETFQTYILSSVAQTEETYSISTVLAEDAIRFVLTWDAVPSDLDSYLIGTASDGTSININFSNMKQENHSGQTIAELDVDDMDGHGPETITLYDTEGSYEFAVVDFTESGTMSQSNAQIKIYVGDSLYQVVDVPSGLANGWTVCRIQDGNITMVNTPRETINGRAK